MFFSSRRHNRLVDRARHFLPFTVFEEQRSGGNHPWQLAAQWYRTPLAREPSWRVTVQPGLVNAYPPAITMAFAEMPAAAQERIRNEAKEAGRPLPKPEERLNAFLDEGPALKLVWRAVGDGAAPDSVSTNPNTGAITGTFEKVPDFFKRLGVRDANPDLLANDVNDPAQRYLAASDVVLDQPRTALTNQVTVGAVVDGVLVSVNPGFTLPPDRQAKVVCLPKFSPPPPLLSVENIFFNRFYDLPVDQVLLATVYALSPAAPADPAKIDASWTLYFRYFCHWNLAHATQAPEPQQKFTPLTLFLPLAGGVADFLMNSFLAQNNNFAQEALDFYRQRSLGGRFWAV